MKYRELILLAMFVTVVNAFKPLAVDDSVNYEFARQLAHHPLDPYGFNYNGVSANYTLVPPVTMYWWAAGLRLFGDQPFLWKLWFLPFNALFVFMLHAFCRRFALGLERPLVWMTVCSPVFWPSLNLMLDVPALALGLLAIDRFVAAFDGQSWAGVLLAGLLAGLAMETKYTAFVAPAVMGVYALLHRRPVQGIIAGLLAALLFVGWEAFIAAKYGESHFLFAFRSRDASSVDKVRLVMPLIGIVGGTASAGILLGLAGLRPSWRMGALVVALIFGGFLLVALIPTPYAVLVPGARPDRPLLTLNTLVFGLSGVMFFAILGMSTWKLVRSSNPWSKRDDVFLLAWLGLEVLGYFFLSPYPAVRRIMGVVLVATLLTGRLAARSIRSWDCRVNVRQAAAVSVALGCLCFTVEYSQYRAEEHVARRLRREFLTKGDGRLVCFSGGCVFGFYMERAGFHPLASGWERLRRGDLIVVLRRRWGFDIPAAVPSHCTEVKRVRENVLIPLRSCYQYGATALEHLDGAMLEVVVYRREQ